MPRFTFCVVAVIASTAVTAQQPTLDEVLLRMDEYIDGYAARLSTIVAEERYHQVFDVAEPARLRFVHEERVLRSDYAITRAADSGAWVGYRDTFERDGKPVRDREDRLQQLLAEGSWQQAARIAAENSRFNIGPEVITRNVNVPTLVLELLDSRRRSRFSFGKSGEEMLNGVRTWHLEYRERQRPTIVRQPNGRDQPSRGSVWVDPATGEIWRTMLYWQSGIGSITVTYGHVPMIRLLVPIAMSERYARGAAVITGDATYSNHRQFQTGARIVVP